MISENIYRPEKQVDPDDEMAAEFANFIDDNRFTAREMREALNQFYGISGNGKPNQAVEKILAKMREMAENKFSVNRFDALINAKQEHESAVPGYYQYVESLDITKKEKAILKSIVEKNRAGTIDFLVDGEVIQAKKIKKTSSPKEDLAAELEGIIRKVMAIIPPGKKCEFMFMED